MKLIGKISDIDIGEEEIICKNPKNRTAVRVILTTIKLQYYTKKIKMSIN